MCAGVSRQQSSQRDRFAPPPEANGSGPDGLRPSVAVMHLKIQLGHSVLTSLSVGNFKAFAETQHVPIRPLTLIFGANSAGKSSLIHSLLLARQASDHG